MSIVGTSSFPRWYKFVPEMVQVRSRDGTSSFPRWYKFVPEMVQVKLQTVAAQGFFDTENKYKNKYKNKL